MSEEEKLFGDNLFERSFENQEIKFDASKLDEVDSSYPDKSERDLAYTQSI